MSYGRKLFVLTSGLLRVDLDFGEATCTECSKTSRTGTLSKNVSRSSH